MLEKHVDILLKSALFQGLKKEEILAILHCFNPTLKGFHANEFIVITGEAFEGVGLMLQGAASVSKENAAGNRMVMTMVDQGELFGEVIAFSDQKKWPATVEAQNECQVLFLPRERIIGECPKMCSWHRVLIRNFLGIISERALFLNKKVEYLTIKSMRAKIATYLLEQYQRTKEISFSLPLNRNELAEFLNVSRPSMSRELGKMKDEGIIDYYLTSFKLLDLDALKKMSIL
jgi:CRP-like cAMP-binding protein